MKFLAKGHGKIGERDYFIGKEQFSSVSELHF